MYYLEWTNVCDSLKMTSTQKQQHVDMLWGESGA